MPREVFPPAARSPRTMTILLVEDDANIAQFLQQLIEEETPYNTTVIDNGRVALEEAPGLLPCLLLLDYRLPGLNGLELYDRLQEYTETRNVPTIMMSATLPVKDLEERGIFQLRKPMDIGAVIRMITHAMATYDERQTSQQH
jgi:two-component system, response regulator, stage 0 sporulation protein F